MATVRQYFQSFIKENPCLGDFYPGFQLHHILDAYFLLYPEEDENSEYQDKEEFCNGLKSGVPLEYLTKNSYFYRSEFYVDERVLIPRSETEILVETAIDKLSLMQAEELRVAEVGVGSFCIGLSILIDSKKTLDFVGGDISFEALEVAHLNLEKLKGQFIRDHKVSLIKSDRLKEFEGRFDLIVSNPPYIRESEDRKGVHEKVDQYEPHLALFLKDDDYNEWFESFFKEVKSKLNPNGIFIMEGHEDTLANFKKCALEYFNTAKIIQDYTQRDRFLITSL